LKVNGKTAVDTNAVIAYRAGVSEVCRLIKEAEAILVPAAGFGGTALRCAEQSADSGKSGSGSSISEIRSVCSV